MVLVSSKATTEPTICSKQFRGYCIIGSMHRGAKRSGKPEGEPHSESSTGKKPGQVDLWIESFLDFCRVEKGLAVNSISSYELDLRKYAAFCPAETTGDVETVRAYVDSLYKGGLSSRSIARHLTTLRNFHQFLLRE